MAIDINEEVKVWGGFNPAEFWLGAAVLTALALAAVFIGTRSVPMLGGAFFFLLGGGFVGLMVYRRALPKGLLGRRFRQDGSFLFLRVPGIHGVDLYHAAAKGRRRRFMKAIGDGREGG